MSLARLTRSMDVQMGSPPELSHTLYLGHSEGAKRTYRERTCAPIKNAFII